MSVQNIQNVFHILTGGVDLKEAYVRGFGITYKQFFELIPFLLDEKIPVIGGSIVHVENNELNLSGDSWSYECKQNKSHDDYVAHSINVAEDYLKKYKSLNKDEFLIDLSLENISNGDYFGVTESIQEPNLMNWERQVIQIFLQEKQKVINSQIIVCNRDLRFSGMLIEIKKTKSLKVDDDQCSYESEKIHGLFNKKVFVKFTISIKDSYIKYIFAKTDGCAWPKSIKSVDIYSIK